jgi:hypothetical protein
MSSDEQPQKVVVSSTGPSSAEPAELADSTEGTPFVDALKKSPFYSHVSSILHWNDPVQSALLFGIGNFFFFLITYGDYTVVSLFAYLALALLFVAGVYANGTLLRAYLKKEKYENPFSAKLKNPFVLTEGDLKPHVDAFVGVVNDFLHLTRHAIYFTDTVFSVKVYHLPPLMIATHHLDEPQLTCSLFSSQIAVIVWFIAIVGGAFSGIVLLYGIFLAAFVWPRIYQEKQADIDRVYGIALAHLNQYYDLVISKLPLGKKKKEE